MNVNIAVELPEDIARRLAVKWGNLSQGTVAAIAIEGYRTGALSQAQVQQLMGLASRWETDAFLKQAGVYSEYTEEDMTRDLEINRCLVQR